MFRVCVRGVGRRGGEWVSVAPPFAPPGECVRRGATVSVCDSSFVDLKLTVLKPMVSTLSQVVNVFFTSTCRCSETKRCSPDLQDKSSLA